MPTEQTASFDQATVEAFINNLKGITDAWGTDWQNASKQRQSLQDQINAQYVRFTEDAHAVLMRILSTDANEAARVSANAHTVDHLADLAALTNPQELSEAAIGAKVAEEVSSTAKEAVRDALGETALTSAAAQGTTGVAQGGLQMQTPVELATILNNNVTIQTAILAELGKISALLTKLDVGAAAS